ncbi:MAG: hypothetical protein ABID84_01385 [Chloroflexota bacterium]
MTLEADGLPAKPFFSCSPEGLVIVDAGEMKNSLRLDSLEPWMNFKHGENNVIDTIPRKVVSWDRSQVTMECEGGTVHIDFAEGRARKVTSEGGVRVLGNH